MAKDEPSVRTGRNSISGQMLIAFIERIERIREESSLPRTKSWFLPS